MQVECPNCGKSITVNSLGRKPLGIAVKIVLDTLQDCRSITLAAEKLRCSRAYIYLELKKHGMSPREVIEGK